MAERGIKMGGLAQKQRRSKRDALAPASGSSLSALVIAAQAGSKVAFEELVRQLGPLVYRFLAVRLRSEADARDALQETLIAAWQRLPDLRDAQSLRSWLLTIAVRKAADLMRRRPRDITSEYAMVSVPDPISGIELAEALAALPDEMRDVVLLRYLVGLSEMETAAALSTRVGTIKSRASRARRRLARSLSSDEETDQRGEQP
jgi:RNA polymerase sigma-70 factor (ECF subfamily)